MKTDPLKIVALALALKTSGLWAGSATNVKIKAVTCIKSLNLCHLVLKSPIINAECAADTHAMWRPNDPLGKEFMSIASAALVSQKNVNVGTSAPCDGGLPVLDSITFVDGNWP